MYTGQPTGVLMSGSPFHVTGTAEWSPKMRSQSSTDRPGTPTSTTCTYPARLVCRFSVSVFPAGAIGGVKNVPC